MLNPKVGNSGKARTCGGKSQGTVFLPPFCVEPCCDAHNGLLQCSGSDGHVTVSLGCYLYQWSWGDFESREEVCMVIKEVPVLHSEQ